MFLEVSNDFNILYTQHKFIITYYKLYHVAYFENEKRFLGFNIFSLLCA